MIKKIKEWFHKKIDTYIIKHHAKNYIHKSKLKDEIKLRVDNAIKQNNKMRDDQEKEKLHSQETKFIIQEAGWISEIERMEKIVANTLKMKKRVTELYYETLARAKEVALITAENKHEGNDIIQKVAESIGKLDRIGANANDMVEQIEKKQFRDENILLEGLK